MPIKRALAFVAVLVGAFLFPATGAWAQTITVTGTADEVSNNGVTSLREAFNTANGNGQGDTIQLQAGQNYVIDACGAGPLTHTATHSLTIQGGSGTTIQNTCGEMQTIVDEDDTSGLTISSVELVGVTVDDSAFVQGVAIKTNGGGLTLSNVEVRGFSAGGGAIVDAGDMGGTANLTNTEIWGNEGNGFRLSFGSLTLTNSQIHDNDGNGVALVDGTPLQISGSSISDNAGTGVTTTGQGHTVVTVTNSTINGNGGLGLGCSACDTVSISGSSISGNGQAASPAGEGGGVRTTWDIDEPTDDPALQITNSTIAFNRAVRPGGGVAFVAFDQDPPTGSPTPQLTITGSNISGNVTQSGIDVDGGGIYVTTGNVTISGGSQILSNSAGAGPGFPGEGGGLYVRELLFPTQPRSVTITDSTINGNQSDVQGGGLYVARRGPLSITGSTINDNLSGSTGGGMYTAAATVTLTTSKVQGNDANVGGGLGHGSFSGLPVGSLLVDKTTVSGNTSSSGSSGGGGIFVSVGGAGAQATLRNATVTGNTSAVYGGGVMVMQTSRLHLNHSTVVENNGSTGANVYVAAGEFRPRRAVIGLANGANPGNNCAFNGTTFVSEGYSWADDTSCNLGAGTNTQAPGVDPKLAPLGAYGGPTPTRRPNAGSPLLGFVPAGSCTLGVDQRNTGRPQGTNCEPGAVEVDEANPK